MGKNKQQAATEARVKKATAPAATQEVHQPAVEQPKPAATPAPAVAAPAAAPAQASKQMQTIEKLKEGWTAKGVDLSKLETKPDGKFLLVTVAPGWPIIQLGPTGGIVLPQIRSYAKAWDAAIDGLAVFQKQQARDQKKAATATPAQPKAAEQTAVTA
jgi:hypothetical protein